MITYKVVTAEVFDGVTPGGDVPRVYSYSVVAKESGVVVAGPFANKGAALAEANLRASAMPGNRVES